MSRPRSNRLIRYSEWDGSQQLPNLDPDEILAALTDDFMASGDLASALRNLMQRGMNGNMDGLRDLLQQLRQQRREKLEQYDLSGIMDDIRKRLAEILRMEREHVDAWLRGENPLGDVPVDGDFRYGETDGNEPAPAPDGAADAGSDDAGGLEIPGLEHLSSGAVEDPDAGAGDAEAGSGGEAGQPEFSNQLLKDIAQRNKDELDALPPDPASRLKALENYGFLNPDAQRKYQELMNELRQAISQTFFRDVENMVKNLSDGDIDRMRDMVKAFNDMLVKKIAGEDPGFEEFMEEFGDMFGDNPPESLDDLLEQMQRQMAAMQSLMDSLPMDQRQQLQQMLADRLGDPGLQQELSKLAKELEYLMPDSSRFAFRGDQQVDLNEAMRLMGDMQDIESLERQLRDVAYKGDIDSVDLDKLQELLGDEARDSVEQMKNLLDVLEQEGYVRRDGKDYELTPRGMRVIGQKALGEIYQQLKKHSLGNHATPREGRFGERVESTKPWEFGDPFHLHMPRTIRNALEREGIQTPVNLRQEDFEVYRNEQITQTATVLMIDLSWSMALRGSFPMAKKVALALQNLITSQFPRDSLYLVGFAAYAQELKIHELPYVQVDEYVLGTNMQHAMMIGEKLLAKHQGATRQIIMVSDGEPTSHLEHGRAQFAYPPSPITIRETLKAVKRCTQKGITINTFMLEESYHLKDFMNQLAKINGGRVFYTSPDQLGEYVLMDYVSHRKKRVGR